MRGSGQVRGLHNRLLDQPRCRCPVWVRLSRRACQRPRSGSRRIRTLSFRGYKLSSRDRWWRSHRAIEMVFRIEQASLIAGLALCGTCASPKRFAQDMLVTAA